MVNVPTVRIDRWLWAARLYKSRTLASAACEAGHVKVAGRSVKPSRSVQPGQWITCVTPGGERVLEVVGLADKRGSAAVARTLYTDHTPPSPARNRPQRGDFGARERGLGRPSKRDRRLLDRLRDQRRGW